MDHTNLETPFLSAHRFVNLRTDMRIIDPKFSHSLKNRRGRLLRHKQLTVLYALLQQLSF